LIRLGGLGRGTLGLGAGGVESLLSALALALATRLTLDWRFGGDCCFDGGHDVFDILYLTIVCTLFNRTCSTLVIVDFVSWLILTLQPTLAGPFNCACGNESCSVGRTPHQTIASLGGKHISARNIRCSCATIDTD